MIADLEKQAGAVILSNLIFPVRPKDKNHFNELKKEIISVLLASN